MPEANKVFSDTTMRKTDETFCVIACRAFGVDLTILDSSEKATVV